MEIRKITKFETSDGTEHSTLQMAKQYVKNKEVCEALAEAVYLRENADPQDIVNWITSHSAMIRDLLDACDAMEKASS